MRIGQSAAKLRTGEASTTRRKPYTQVSGNAEHHFGDEDIVLSTMKVVAESVGQWLESVDHFLDSYVPLRLCAHVPRWHEVHRNAFNNY